jgi:hypothetical protein
MTSCGTTSHAVCRLGLLRSHSDDGGARRQARGAAAGLHPGRRQVDAEPAGAEPARQRIVRRHSPQLKTAPYRATFDQNILHVANRTPSPAATHRMPQHFRMRLVRIENRWSSSLLFRPPSSFLYDLRSFSSGFIGLHLFNVRSDILDHIGILGEWLIREVSSSHSRNSGSGTGRRESHLRSPGMPISLIRPLWTLGRPLVIGDPACRLA